MSKKRIIFVTLVFIFVSFSCFCYAWHEEKRDSPYGFAHILDEFDKAATSGAEWGRIYYKDGTWGLIEKEYGVYDFSNLDARIRQLDKAGFNILLTLRTGGFVYDAQTKEYQALAWVDTQDDPELPPIDSAQLNIRLFASFPPADIEVEDGTVVDGYEHWYEFVKTVVRRYNGTTPDPEDPTKTLPKVLYFMTQEEQDSVNFWYGSEEEFFDKLLPKFCQAVHEANPEAKVVAGGNTGGFLAALMAINYYEGYTDEQGIWHPKHTEQQTLDYANLCYRYIGDWQGDRITFDNWNELYNVLYKEDLSRGVLYHTSRAARFIEKFLQYNPTDRLYDYDILGLHHYESYANLNDFIKFIKMKLKINGIQEKPMWITEMGHMDSDTFFGGEETEEEIAENILKKIIIAFKNGVRHINYFSMLEVPQWVWFYYPFKGLYKVKDFNLYDGLIYEPTLLQKGFSFIASKINEKTGYKFSHFKDKDGIKRYFFKKPDSEYADLEIIWYEPDNIEMLFEQSPDRHSASPRPVESQRDLYGARALSPFGPPFLRKGGVVSESAYLVPPFGLKGKGRSELSTKGGLIFNKIIEIPIRQDKGRGGGKIVSQEILEEDRQIKVVLRLSKGLQEARVYNFQGEELSVSRHHRKFEFILDQMPVVIEWDYLNGVNLELKEPDQKIDKDRICVKN